MKKISFAVIAVIVFAACKEKKNDYANSSLILTSIASLFTH